MMNGNRLMNKNKSADETFTLKTGKNAPDPQELLRIHNEMNEECRRKHEEDRLRNYILDDHLKIVVNSIKPEWLRREIVETISNGGEVRFSLYHGNRKLSEYPVQLIDSHY